MFVGHIEMKMKIKKSKGSGNLFCNKCGTKMEKDSNFCENCGNQMGGEKNKIQKDGPSNVSKHRTIKKPKWIVAAVIVAMILIGLLAKEHIVYAVSPELHIKLATNNTIKEIQKHYSQIQSILFGKNTKNPSYSTSIKANMNYANHTDDWTNQDLSMLNGIGVNLSTLFDEKNKELYLGGKYIIQGDELLSINTKLDDNELLINIPELFDHPLSIPSKNLGKDWNRSLLYEDSRFPLDETLDISISNLEAIFKVDKMDKETKKAYMNSLKLMIQNARYEKSGREDLIIGDSSKKCNKTTIILNQEDIKQGIIALLDVLKKDKGILGLGNTIQGFNPYSIYGGVDYNEGIEEVIEEITRIIREDLELDKFVVTVFTHKNNIVKSKIAITPDQDYVEETLTYDLELLGKESILDYLKLEFKAGEEKYIYESKGNHTGQKNSFSDNTTIELYSYGNLAILKSSLDIDLSKNKNNLNADFKVMFDDGGMSLSTNGDFNSSTKSTEFKSDNIYFTFEDYGDVLNLDFSLDYKTQKDINNKPHFNNPKKLQLLEMNEYELESLIDEFDEKGYYLGNKIESYMGY